MDGGNLLICHSFHSLNLMNFLCYKSQYRLDNGLIFELVALKILKIFTIEKKNDIHE